MHFRTKKNMRVGVPESKVVAKSTDWLQDVRLQVGLLLLICGLTFFPNLGSQDPSLMEARNFITAREMLESGHWLVPTLNGEVRLAKPPLPTWITALAGRAAGDIYNLRALRLPAATMAMLMVYFLFLLACQLTSDKLIPFLAAAILAGCVAVFNAARQGTWDIYCHSFMLGAIWLLWKGWQDKEPGYGIFAGCGLLLGCSFLSKGPVAFYALLLPFLVSYRLSFGPGAIQDKWKGVLLAALVGVLVSASWPLYIYLLEPEALAHNVAGETQAWFSRHRQPFWHYWGFVAQSGAWTLFAGAALVVPYARRRIEPLGNYRFLFVWVLLTFLLLSAIPEKKERYQLPLLVPVALLTGCYLRYLIRSISQEPSDKWSNRIIRVSTGLFLLACCAMPVLAYAFAFQGGHLTGFSLAGIAAGSLLFGYLLLRFAFKRHAGLLILSVVLLNAVVLGFGVPLAREVLYPGEGLRHLKEVRNNPELSGLSFYAVDGMKPEQLWEVGKRVDTLRLVNRRLELPEKLPAAVFSRDPLVPANLPGKAYSMQKVETYHIDRKHLNDKYHVYVVRAIQADL